MKDLTIGTIPKIINKLSVDNFTGLISLFILGIVDSYFLSFYGNNDLAAATYSNPFVFSIVAIFVGIGYAKTVFLSKKYASSKDEMILFSNYIDSFIFISYIIIITISSLSIKNIFILTNINTEILDISFGYSIIHFIGFFFCLFNICLGSFLRSMGNTKILSQTFLIISILNIILDPIFIFYFDLGAKGAALATSISWFISAIYIFYMVFFKLDLPLKIKKTNLTYLKKLIPSSVIQNLLNPLTIIITVISINKFGVEATSGYGIGFRLEKLFIVISLAIASSLLIFSGQNSLNKNRQIQGLKYCIKINFYISFIFTIIFFIFSSQIVSIFELTDNANTIAITYLKILSISFLIQGTQNIYNSYLNVINKHNTVLFVSTIKAFFILPICLFAGGYFFSTYGIFLGLVIHYLLTLLITISITHKDICNFIKYK